MVTQGANVRRGVLVFTSIMITLELAVFALTVVFYLYATSEDHGDFLARNVLKNLYPEQYRSLRKSGALEFHILVSGAIQLLLMLPTILLVIGATNRIRFLLLPFLVVFGLLQLAMLTSVVFVVLALPTWFKLISIGIAALEAFVVFPWWYSAIHLFALFSQQEESASADMKAIIQAVMNGHANSYTNSTRTPPSLQTPSWSGVHTGSYSIGRSSSTTKISDI